MRYAAPTTVDEARELLSGDPDARVFAGATDLIPQIRAGRPEPSLLVDLKRIERLVSVAESGGNQRPIPRVPATHRGILERPEA